MKSKYFKELKKLL